MKVRLFPLYPSQPIRIHDINSYNGSCAKFHASIKDFGWIVLERYNIHLNIYTYSIYILFILTFHFLFFISSDYFLSFDIIYVLRFFSQFLFKTYSWPIFNPFYLIILLVNLNRFLLPTLPFYFSLLSLCISFFYVFPLFFLLYFSFEFVNSILASLGSSLCIFFFFFVGILINSPFLIFLYLIPIFFFFFSSFNQLTFKIHKYHT